MDFADTAKALLDPNTYLKLVGGGEHKVKTLWQQVILLTYIPRQPNQTHREYVQNNLSNSLGGDLLEILQIIFSIVLVSFFIYMNWDDASGNGETMAMKKTEVALCIFFAIDYGIRLYAAANRRRYIFSFFPLVDVITIFPPLLVFTESVLKKGTVLGDDFSYMEHLYERTRFFRPLRVLRALRIVKAYRILKFVSSPLYRQMITVMITVISVLVCSAGIIQHVEYCDPGDYTRRCADQHVTPQLSYLDALYFCCVTISTVGYGDYSPQTPYGRICVIVMIMVAIVVVPVEAGNLTALINKVNPYDKEFKQQFQKIHIILTGAVDADTLKNFVSEFFHTQQMNWNCKVVVLYPSYPSEEVARFVQNPELDGRVVYLNGSPLSDDDLTRARAGNAAAIFLLTPSQGSTPKFDNTAVFVINSLRHFNSTVPIFSQCVRAENVPTLLMGGSTDVLCLDQLKYNLMSMNSIYSGFSTLIANLVSSVSDNILDVKYETWYQEYARGALARVVIMPLPQDLANMAFVRISKVLYEHYEALLFAVVDPLTSHLPPAEQSILLAPHNYISRAEDTIFVLCADNNVAARITDTIEHVMAIIRQRSVGSDDWGAASPTNGRHGSMQLLDTITSGAKNLLPGQMKSKGSRVEADHETDNPLGEDASDEGVAMGGLLHKTKSKKSLFRTAVKKVNLVMSRKNNRQISSRYFHVGDEKVTYDAFISKTSEKPLTNHVVIFGVPDDPMEFLAPLRTKNITAYPPVVFVNPRPLPEDLVNQIKVFPEIYCVVGKLLSHRTMRQACVSSAKSVTILKSPSQEETDFVDPLMIDADAITVLNMVKEYVKTTQVKRPLSDQLFIQIELIHPGNLKFLSSMDPMLNAEDAKKLKEIMSEESDIPARVEQKSKYEKYLLRIKDVFKPEEDVAQASSSPIVMSGGAFISHLCEKLMSSSLKRIHLLNLIKLLISSKVVEGYSGDIEREKGEDRLDDIHLSSVTEVFMVPIPSRFHKLTFIELFDSLLSIGVVCISIYRSRHRMKAPTDYVYTKPAKTTILYDEDMMYVIGYRSQIPSIESLLPLEGDFVLSPPMSPSSPRHKGGDDTFEIGAI